MTLTKEQQIAALLSVLRPTPAAWIAAASGIPRLERELSRPPPSVPAEPLAEPQHGHPSSRGGET
jgi:hypothetical protein